MAKAHMFHKAAILLMELRYSWHLQARHLTVRPVLLKQAIHGMNCTFYSSPKPLTSQSAPQTTPVSKQVTRAAAFVKTLCSFFPIPIGHTPRHLSRAIRQLNFNALMFCLYIIVLDKFRVRRATTSQSLSLQVPKRSKNFCQ